MNAWKTIKTWPTSPAYYVSGGTRYTSADGVWIEVNDSATIGSLAKIGNSARIGDSAMIGNWATIGYSATIGKTPLYLMPTDGRWPVYVSDPEKQLIGIGCEIHSADFWLNGGADKVREKHGTQDTKERYDAAIMFVCEQMGWFKKKGGA